MANIIRDVYGTGKIWTPNLEDEEVSEEDVEEHVEKFRESFDPENYEEPYLGNYNEAKFRINEMYVDRLNTKGKTILAIRANIGLFNFTINIPLNVGFKGFVRDLAEELGVKTSGMYFDHGDYQEVMKKSCDEAGRVTLGKDYGDEEVKVVVMEEDN